MNSPQSDPTLPSRRKIEDHFPDIRTRWILFFREPSIMHFSTFVSGFTLGAASPDESLMWEFQRWLKEKFQVKLNLGWVDIILLHVSGNDPAGFDRGVGELIASLQRTDWDAKAFAGFWTLWDEFILQRPDQHVE